MTFARRGLPNAYDKIDYLSSTSIRLFAVSAS